jgi:hypothetical protein
MNNARSQLLVLLCAFGPLLPTLLAEQGWTTFKSPQNHFRVQYPSSWHPLNPGETRFDIINFPPSERAEGVILNATGARIWLSAAPPEIKNVDELILQEPPSDSTEGDERIPIARLARDGCLTLRRVITKGEIGPNVYFVYTTYYCSTKRGIYLAVLINRERDPHQEELRAIALRIVLSLRAF